MAEKVRVFKLAKEFAVENEVMVAKIQNLGFQVRNYMSALEPEDARTLQELASIIKYRIVPFKFEENPLEAFDVEKYTFWYQNNTVVGITITADYSKNTAFTFFQ